MTPAEYVARIRALVRSEQWEAAMELARQHDAEMLPQLSLEEFVFLGSLMELVDTMVDPDGLATQSESRVSVPAWSESD